MTHATAGMEPLHIRHSKDFVSRWASMVSRALHWRHKGEFVCVPSLSGKTTLSYLPFLSYTDIGREDAEELAAAAAPYRYQIRLLAPQQSAFSLSDPVTMRLSLVNRSSNKLWSEALSGKCRNQIRKAKHNKIRIESSSDDKRLRQFYRLLAGSLHSYGAPLPPFELFEGMCRELDAIVYVAYNDDEPVAAFVALQDGKLVWIPFAASNRQYLKLCPNHLLYWQAISDAERKGASVFDFGRSPFLSNTYRFKRQWGAQAVGLHTQPHPSRDVYSRLALAQRTWRAIPRPLADRLGPWLCHYLADY